MKIYILFTYGCNDHCEVKVLGCYKKLKEAQSAKRKHNRNQVWQADYAFIKRSILK